MTEYKIGNAIVRVHGEPDKEKLKAATAQYIKQVRKKKSMKKS